MSIQTVQDCARGLSLQPSPLAASVAEFTRLSQQARKMFLQTEGRALTSEEEREDKVYFRSVTAASDSVIEGIVAEESKTGSDAAPPFVDRPVPTTLIPSPLSSAGPATADNNDNTTITDTLDALPTLSRTIYTSTRPYTAQPLDSLEELNNHIIITAGVTMKTVPTHTGTLEKVRIVTDPASLSTADNNKLREEKAQEYTRVAITVTDDDDSSEGSDEEEEKGHNSDHLSQLHLPKQNADANNDGDMSVDSSSSSRSSSDSSDGGGRGLDFEGESSFTRLNITENNNNDDDSSGAGSGDEGGDDSNSGGEEQDGTGGKRDDKSGEEEEDEEEDDFIVIPIRHSHDTPTTAAVAASSLTTAPTASAATDTPPIIPLPAPVCSTPASTPSADVTLPPISPSTTDIAEQQALLYKEQGNECIRNKHYTEAIGNYTMSIKFDPTLASAYNNRASVCITLKVHFLLYTYRHALCDIFVFLRIIYTI